MAMIIRHEGYLALAHLRRNGANLVTNSIEVPAGTAKGFSLKMAEFTIIKNNKGFRCP
jgi:hypothetical protein